MVGKNKKLTVFLKREWLNKSNSAPWRLRICLKIERWAEKIKKQERNNPNWKEKQLKSHLVVENLHAQWKGKLKRLKAWRWSTLIWKDNLSYLMWESKLYKNELQKRSWKRNKFQRSSPSKAKKEEHIKLKWTWRNCS